MDVKDVCTMRPGDEIREADGVYFGPGDPFF